MIFRRFVSQRIEDMSENKEELIGNIQIYIKDLYENGQPNLELDVKSYIQYYHKSNSGKFNFNIYVNGQNVYRARTAYFYVLLSIKDLTKLENIAIQPKGSNIIFYGTLKLKTGTEQGYYFEGTVGV